MVRSPAGDSLYDGGGETDLRSAPRPDLAAEWGASSAPAQPQGDVLPVSNSTLKSDDTTGAPVSSMASSARHRLRWRFGVLEEVMNRRRHHGTAPVSRR